MPSTVLVRLRRRDGAEPVTPVPLPWRGGTFLLEGGSLPLGAEQKRRWRRTLGASLALQMVLGAAIAAGLRFGSPLLLPPMEPAPEVELLTPAPVWVPPPALPQPTPAHPLRRYLRLRVPPPTPEILLRPRTRPVVRASQAPPVPMKLPPLLLALAVAAPPPAELRVGKFGTPQGLTPAPAATVKVPVLGQFGGATAAADPPDPPSSPAASLAGFGSATVAAGPAAPLVGEHAAGFGDAGPVAARPLDHARLFLDTFGAPAAAAPSRSVSAPPAAAAVEPPQVLAWPTPAYTPAAVRRGIQGEVVLQVRLRADGGVEVLRVIQGLGYGLDQSAIAAARQLQFRPARKHGQPMDWTVLLHVQFRLAN